MNIQPPEQNLFNYISIRNPELFAEVQHCLRNGTLHSAFVAIAQYYDLEEPLFSDPIAGTSARMLSAIKRMEDDRK